MGLSDLERRMRAELPALKLTGNEPMSAHTSFKIGGAAKLFALPESIDELLSVLEISAQEGIKPIIIGSGSNILAPDAGINNLVIKTRGIEGIRLLDGRTVEAECGASLSRLAMTAANNRLGGLEFAHGIPGSVGGAVLMNAGAYGGEIKDVCIETDCLIDGAVVTLAGEAQSFAYRKSAFSNGDCVILRSRFRLDPRAGNEVIKEMEELSAKRRASQPLEKPSAGSTFKRPAGGYAAALIDAAGLKGFSIGGAMVSDKHAGFIVNTGGATAADVIALIEHIKKKVRDDTGIELEPEVRIL